MSSKAELVHAIQQKLIDYVLTNPSLMVNLINDFQLISLAGEIDVINSIPTKYSAGNIVVPIDSPIKVLSELKFKKIISLPPDDLTGFQVQVLKLLEHGSYIAQDASIIAFEMNTEKIMTDLLKGNFDAGFVPAIAAESIQGLRVLEPKLYPEYPIAVTSDVFWLPNIAALISVPDNIIRNVTCGLFNSVESKDNHTRRFWTAPHDDTKIRKLQESLGITEGHSLNIPLDYVICPPKTSKLSEKDVFRNCLIHSLECTNRTCICSPCFLQTNSPISSPVIFWCITMGSCLFCVLLSWWFQATWLTEYFIAEIPVQHIVFFEHTEVLGESRYGKIIKAELTTPGRTRHRTVAIHRLEPSKSGQFNNHFGNGSENVQDMGQSDIWKRAAKIHQIHHPNLLENYGIIKSHSELLIVQEYAEVGTLQDYLSNKTVTLDIYTALRIFKEIAMALQCIHSRSPPLTHHVTMYNVLLDINHSVLLMLSDNFNLPPFSPAADVFHFGTLMSHVTKEVSPSNAIEKYLLEKHLKSVYSIVNDCRCADLLLRPNISRVIKRLTECQFRWQMEYDEHINKQQQTAQQNTAILYRVFPRHIADALSIGKTIQPEHHDIISILFTDIVGYTSIASTLSPLKVSDMLNRLYLRFDELANSLGIFKVETIGDSYLGTTNLIDKAYDHTARLAKFAEEIMRIAQNTSVDTSKPDQTLQIRIGIHAGPVVANVVGSVQTNPRFCLFGDSVNLASRMESTSLPGKIQLSEVAAEMISQQDLEMKHKICIRPDKPDVKGKGLMQTYWLL